MTVDNENVTLHYVINQAINSRLASLNTAMPAIVDKFDSEKKTCDVAPIFKKRYKNGDVTAMPVIQNIPVVFLQTINSIVSLPIKRGDIVLLVFCQRSMDEWKTKGGVLEPVDKRKHDLNDAVAIPGVFPIGKGLEADSAALKIQNGNLSIKVYENGKLEIKNNSQELISLLNEFCEETKNFAQEVANITTVVMGAPVPPTNIAQLTMFITKFSMLLNKLAVFKK